MMGLFNEMFVSVFGVFLLSLLKGFFFLHVQPAPLPPSLKWNRKCIILSKQQRGMRHKAIGDGEEEREKDGLIYSFMSLERFISSHGASHQSGVWL